MTINYTTLLGLAEPVTGTESGTWGDDVNKGITDYLDIAIAGTQTISGSQTAVTLSVTNGSSSGSNISQAGSGSTGSAQYAIINCTGNPAGLLTITVPASSRIYHVINATSTNQSVKIVGAGPTTGVTLVSGEKATVVWNGSDYIKISNTSGSGSFTDLTVSGNLTLSGGTANGVAYLNGSKVLTTGSALTWNGTTFGASGNQTVSGADGLFVSGTVSGSSPFIAGGNLELGATASSALIQAYNRPSFGAYNLDLKTTTAFTFSLAGSEQMRLTSTGLGIGTSSPITKLYVTVSAANAACAAFLNTDTANGNGVYIKAGGVNSGKYALAIDNAASSSLLFLDSSGNLGIGTSSPSNRVTAAVSNSSTNDPFGTASVGVFAIQNTSTTAGTSTAIINQNPSNTSANAYIRFINQDGAWQSAISFGTATSGATNYGERMRLDSSGNLGLGVTPSAWFASNNTKAMQLGGGSFVSYLNNQVWLANNYFLNASGQDTYVNNGAAMRLIMDGAYKFQIAPSGTAGNAISFTQVMTLDASGNLLVGGTTNSGGLKIMASDGTVQAGFLPYASGSIAYTGTWTNHAFGFATNGSERARIDSSGNLLVGTTNTGQNIPNGVTTQNIDAGTQLNIGHTNGTGSGTSYLAFAYNSGNIGSITQNGTTGVLYNIMSDHRLKDVVGAVTGSGERIDALKPVNYTWKANGSAACGFLAHEFQEVYANSVTGTKDAVDAEGNPIYQQMQASTTEVIADLVAEIQSLRKRLAAAGIA